jgi:Glutathione S-transferase, N-terminal domain
LKLGKSRLDSRSRHVIAPVYIEGQLMLEVDHNDMSTCAQKVRFALAEKGVRWQSRHLDLRARDHQTSEYLRLNPNAVVPTIAHDGTVIIESTIINEYIDDAFPGPALRPPDSIGRARMRLWTKQLDEGLNADTGARSTAIAVRCQKLKKGLTKSRRSSTIFPSQPSASGSVPISWKASTRATSRIRRDASTACWARWKRSCTLALGWSAMNSRSLPHCERSAAIGATLGKDEQFGLACGFTKFARIRGDAMGLFWAEY